jgi:hypothetical protein
MLLLILIVVLGLGVVIAALMLPGPFSLAPNSLLLTYSEQPLKCHDKIEVYRNGGVKYFCDNNEISSDTVPAEQLTRLLDAATRLPSRIINNMMIPYNLTFYGDAKDEQSATQADRNAVAKIARDLFLKMRNQNR